MRVKIAPAIASVETKPCLVSSEHTRVIITTKAGRCYSATYAGDAPSEAKVQADWIEDCGPGITWQPYRS